MKLEGLVIHWASKAGESYMDIVKRVVEWQGKRVGVGVVVRVVVVGKPDRRSLALAKVTIVMVV